MIYARLVSDSLHLSRQGDCSNVVTFFYHNNNNNNNSLTENTNGQLRKCGATDFSVFGNFSWTYHVIVITSGTKTRNEKVYLCGRLNTYPKSLCPCLKIILCRTKIRREFIRQWSLLYLLRKDNFDCWFFRLTSSPVCSSRVCESLCESVQSPANVSAKLQDSKYMEPHYFLTAVNPKRASSGPPLQHHNDVSSFAGP